jgi:hypothetical protein
MLPSLLLYRCPEHKRLGRRLVLVGPSIRRFVTENVELSTVVVNGAVQHIEAPPSIWTSGGPVKSVDEVTAEMPLGPERLNLI